MYYNHVLVAVDLTEECDPVVKRALALCEGRDTQLSLVHIVEPMAMAFGGDVPMDLSQLQQQQFDQAKDCLLYTSPSPRDRQKSRMPSSA